MPVDAAETGISSLRGNGKADQPAPALALAPIGLPAAAAPPAARQQPQAGAAMPAAVGALADALDGLQAEPDEDQAEPNEDQAEPYEDDVSEEDPLE